MSSCAPSRLIAIATALACCANGPDRARSDDADPGAATQPQIIVDVSEEMLNRFVATTDTRIEPVRDFVLGADVFGWQQTTTRSALDIRPAGDWIAAELVLHGTTLSDTVGYTPQARAYTSGWHEFEARKEIAFPGDFLYTRRARVRVRPHIHTRGICPVGGGLPLIGPLVINIAFQQAESRRPLAESIAGHKIAEAVRDNFNRDLDAQLSTLNRAIENERTDWPLTGALRPDVRHFRSTETLLSYRGRFATDREITAIPEHETDEVSRLGIHESIISEVVARAGLAGQEFVPDDAFLYLEAVLRGLEDRAVPPLAPELSFVRPTGPFGQLPVRLDTEAPIEVLFRQDELEFTLRARLQLVPDQWSPPLLMRFVYRIETFDDYISATPEARLVKPVDNALGLLLLQPVIRQRLQEMLPVVHVPRTLEWELESAAATDAEARTVRLHVERLIAADGWLRLRVD